MAAETSLLSDSTMTSTGHSLSTAVWLDIHYLAGQPEYEAMLQSVGIQAGWHVLDGGCGGGNYLSLLAKLVGEQGQISVVDLAPENIARVEAIVQTGQFPCLVNAHTGDVTTLNFAPNTFDAIWNANVAQYLPDRELQAMLAEFHRVLKPGGIIAIKDTEDTAFQIYPIPPRLLWRLLDVLAQRGEMTVVGGLRALQLPRYVENAGFIQVAKRVSYIERYAPLGSVESQFIATAVEWLAQAAQTLDLPPADLEMWQTLSNPASSGYILSHPDLYWREANILVVGYKP